MLTTKLMFVGFLVACLYCFMMLSYSSRHRHDQKLRLPSSVVMGDEMLEHNELILPALRIDDRNGMPLEPWYDMEATDWSAPPVIIDANRSVIARNIKTSLRYRTTWRRKLLLLYLRSILPCILAVSVV